MENEKRVIALGFFDGVHIGHQALIKKTAECADRLGAVPSVISFDTHPMNMIPGNEVPLINTPLDRLGIIHRLFGIYDVIFLHFDEKMIQMEWDAFIDWLVHGFGAVHLVAGYNFSFGYQKLGDAEKLRRKCEKDGIGCDIIDVVKMDGEKVSSTRVRELLLNGEMDKATRFLGHPHVMTETVRYGYKFGRTLGIPTINQMIPEGIIVPKHGVYVSTAHIEDGREFMSVTNIGVRPTVGGKDNVSVETHLIGYSGNLYGQSVRIELFRYIRPETKFENTEQLRARILEDMQETRDFFGY